MFLTLSFCKIEYGDLPKISGVTSSRKLVSIDGAKGKAYGFSLGVGTNVSALTFKPYGKSLVFL